MTECLRHDAWQTTVQDHLMASGLINGVSLLSGQNGCCTYTSGDICEQQDWNSFTRLFDDKQDVIPKLSIVIDQKKVEFTIFRKTECSIYAVSEGTVYGLIVCSYPNGTIVVACPGKPSIMNRAVPLVEQFVTMLRQ